MDMAEAGGSLYNVRMIITGFRLKIEANETGTNKWKRSH